MKTILITGAAGFIGSHLSDKFLDEGFKVIGIDNYLTGSPDNINHLRDDPNFKFYNHNIISPINLGEKIDLILHFACPASPVDYMKFPIETLKVDSIGTLNTLEIARHNNARYVFASTSEIYGDPHVHPQTEEYWGNVNPIGPRSVYDEAKRFSESLCMAYYRKYGVDVRIVRIFNTYGPRMKADDGRVVPNFINQALKGDDITVYGDGSQTRSFCYVNDLVEGIFRTSLKDNINGEVLNLGNPDEYSIIDFAEIIFDLIKSKSEIIFQDLPVDDPKKRRPDISKAKETIKWKPETKLEDGLKKTIKYFNQEIQ
ncbi:MAG: UDP-glucuronic acid decarboxylase family protein [Methanobacterium sp.]